jgi:uncharacterized damage-inducible protein DinB
LKDEPTLDNLEVAAAYDALSDTLERLLACIEGLDVAQLNWRPPVDGGNSLAVLIVHTLANVEENMLEILGGEPVGRNREEEFLAQDVSADTLRARHAQIMAKVRARLATLPPGELDRERTHPRRGTVTGRRVLWIVVRHAAEHQGHAELTRDWMQSTGTQHE